MTLLRKFLYAGLLALAALSFVSSAAAQSMAHGKFALPHEVHWQNALVPAGDYRFSLDGNGSLCVLTLAKMSGTRTGFLLLIKGVDDAKATDTNKLVLERTANGSYVSAMQLSQFGMTLRFEVPAQAREQQIAKTTTMASAGAQ
jgi:hypothetical protein